MIQLKLYLCSGTNQQLPALSSVWICMDMAFLPQHHSHELHAAPTALWMLFSALGYDMHPLGL